MEELKKKSEQELAELLKEKREILRKERFNVAGAGRADTKVIKGTKREVAQILTELSARAKVAPESK